MKKRILVGLFMLGATLCAEETGLKPRGVRRQKVSEIKQTIGGEYEKVLTSASSLIASLSELIDTTVKKLKQLVTSDDPFFGKRKAPVLKEYERRLKILRTNCEKRIADTKREIAAFKKDFEL